MGLRYTGHTFFQLLRCGNVDFNCTVLHFNRLNYMRSFTNLYSSLPIAIFSRGNLISVQCNFQRYLRIFCEDKNEQLVDISNHYYVI